MSNCNTCKHWLTTDDWSGDNEAGWALCVLASGRDGKAVNKDALAYADDAESYSARLITNESFGCVQHEPKP